MVGLNETQNQASLPVLPFKVLLAFAVKPASSLLVLETSL